jgi:hypothetical protein
MRRRGDAGRVAITLLVWIAAASSVGRLLLQLVFMAIL